jgi:hypothetical protein
MIEILTSDPAIVLLSSLGLMVTAASIVRDTRTQHARKGRMKKLPTLARRREKIAA